jgi:predicted O-methyltransferase YrrM
VDRRRPVHHDTLVRPDATLAAVLDPEYFGWALDLSRTGSLIIVDNVVRGGAVLDATSDDPVVQGVRRLNARLAAEPRVSAVALQTVGIEGWDGMAIVLVTDGRRD